MIVKGERRVLHSFMGLAMIIFFLGLSSCTVGKNLKTESARPGDVTGTFSLILYGCTHYDDLAVLAILAKEDSRYPFEVYAPQYDYRIKKNIPAEQALKEAETFVSCHRSSRQSSLRKIVDSAGSTLGYEVRPSYSFIPSDVLDIGYVMNSKVTVFVRLKEQVLRELQQ